MTSTRRAERQSIAPAAVAHLRAADPVLRRVIDRVGIFQPSHEPDLWWALIDAIASQQLSVKAAATILGRLAALGGEKRPTPQELLNLPDEALRGCGLSRAKVGYVRDVAAKWVDGTLEPERLPQLSDEDVVEHLVRVKGIGRWSAEMVLIFSLRRPDVLPVADLGLRTAVHRAYELPERPSSAQVLEIGATWAPFRTAASLYLWRSL